MWVTAIILGLAGSLHCAGMCSPLMMAVSNSSAHAVANRLFYNAGRILTYAILGSVVSALGVLLPIAKYQNLLSIAMGILMLLIAVFHINGQLTPAYGKLVAPFMQFLKDQFAFFLRQKNYASIGFLGMINGLLPCGVSLLALTYCVILKGPLDGFNFMILFGVGTLPVMLGVAPLVMALTRKLNMSFQRVTLTMIAFSGVVLIARVFLHAGIEASKHGKDFVDIVLCR